MNIADEFFSTARLHADRTALVVGEESLTFSELQNLTHSYARGLRTLSQIRGKKVLVFLKPSLDFPAIVFALFQVGAIPIFIDPGMGLKSLLNAIVEVAPDMMIAEPIVYGLRLFKKKYFTSITHFYSRGSTIGLGKEITPLSSLRIMEEKEEVSEDLLPDELCAILFTSGGTGTPKGVEYTHRIFSTQTKLLQELFGLTAEDVDIPGFPLFSLFALCMGLKSCPPPMNPSKPAKANPQKLVEWIKKNQGSFVAGSPAIWENVADYCIKNRLTLPSVRYLVMFGAPVSISLHQKFKNVLTQGSTYTPYGATESLPVACISGHEVLENTASLSLEGKGTCVGKVVPHIQVKIISPSQDAIPDLRETTEQQIGVPGEIIVAGDVVTAKYFGRAKETMRAKIYEALSDGKIRIWHRIGDMGYLDSENRLWFLGRATHAIELNHTLHFSIPCEAIFNRHPEVKRSALIEIKNPKNHHLAIVVERRDRKILKGRARERFEQELLDLGKSYKHTEEINKVFHHKSFPVDVRHNIKIDRLKLRDHFNAEYFKRQEKNR